MVFSNFLQSISKYVILMSKSPYRSLTDISCMENIWGGGHFEHHIRYIIMVFSNILRSLSKYVILMSKSSYLSLTDISCMENIWGTGHSAERAVGRSTTGLGVVLIIKLWEVVIS